MNAQTEQQINKGTIAAEGQAGAAGEHARGKGDKLARRRRWMKRQRRLMRQQQAGQPVSVTINIHNGPQRPERPHGPGRPGGPRWAQGPGRSEGFEGPEGPGHDWKAMKRRKRRAMLAMQGEGPEGPRGKGYGRGPGFGRGKQGRKGRTMKITTPQGYVIEMSPEEARMMFPDLFRGLHGQVAGLGADKYGDGAPVSERRIVRRVLKRHRIPPAQRAVYKALYAAGDEGLDFATLAETIGRSTEELSGVLGGLGRRINATPGIETLPEAPGVGLLFEHKEVAPPKGAWGWALKPEFRQVLTDLDLPWLTSEDESEAAEDSA